MWFTLLISCIPALPKAEVEQTAGSDSVKVRIKLKGRSSSSSRRIQKKAAKRLFLEEGEDDNLMDDIQ